MTCNLLVSLSSPILATTPSASAPLAREQQSQPVLDVIPQQFKKVRNDSEGATCARTDLEYVHPPPEQKRALSEPQKVRVHVILQLVYYIFAIGYTEFPTHQF